MITLYQFAPIWGIPNLSHFCVKVETYLRMMGLEYEVLETLPLKAPLGKLPYMKDEGHKIADSRLILQYLQQQYGHSLDNTLTLQEQATAKAWQRLIEDHLYWLSMYSRWSYTDINWQHNKQAIFHVLPIFIRDGVALVYRHLIKKQIYGQGIGRLNQEAVFALAHEDIVALAVFLGDKKYFMGENPTSIDASVYGFLINIIGCPIESPIKETALEQTQLVAYCQRMQNQYFPECGDLKL